MAYTVTVRQAGVKRAEVGALLTHEYRKTLEHDGTTTQHDNENIDPTRSHLNRDYIFRNGELEPLIKVSDIHEELDRRLENAGGTRTLKDGSVKKIGLRSDAKVLRNFIVQLDPEHTGTVEEWEQKPEAERQKDLSLMVDTLIKDHIGGLYGKENLLSMTLHMDEKSPHIHLMVTPIDDEGRIRNESFIKNKSDMRKFWDGARTKLRDAGYEAEMVTRDVDAKHETLRQFKTRTGKAKAEALELEEKARKQREEMEKEAREAEKRLRADLEEQIKQARLNLTNDLKSAREELETVQGELERVKTERDQVKESAEVWISTQENIQETIDTLEEERDNLQDEKDALTSENSRLQKENEQWSAKNSNFLEGWVKAQSMFGRPSEENRKMLAEALEARQRAEELHDKAEAKIKKAADVEQRTAEYVVKEGENRISKKVDELLLKERQELAQERLAVRSKARELSDKENNLRTRENAISEKEKKLTLEASRVDARVKYLEGLKSFASVSLEHRDSVVALAGFLAHAKHRADVDKHNQMVKHIDNYSQVKPYETRLNADQIQGYLGDATELYNRGRDENAYTKLKARYNAPSQTQGYGYGR